MSILESHAFCDNNNHQEMGGPVLVEERNCPGCLRTRLAEVEAERDAAILRCDHEHANSMEYTNHGMKLYYQNREELLSKMAMLTAAEAREKAKDERIRELEGALADACNRDLRNISECAERTKERDAYQKLWHREAKAVKVARAVAFLEVIHLMAPDGEAGSEHEKEILNIISGWRSVALSTPSPSQPVKVAEEKCECGVPKDKHTLASGYWICNRYRPAEKPCEPITSVDGLCHTHPRGHCPPAEKPCGKGTPGNFYCHECSDEAKFGVHHGYPPQMQPKSYRGMPCRFEENICKEHDSPRADAICKFVESDHKGPKT